MLIDSDEYKKLHEVEGKLWWFLILHQKVLEQIKAHFVDKTISILDAGCGTGGLLEKLKAEGYSQLQGFDFSDDAVKFTNQRGFPVKKINILECDTHFTPNQFDVIISNDVCYQFDDVELEQLLKNLFKILKPNGIIISNNQALNAFRGIHDIAVGAKRRFNRNDFRNNAIINQSAELKTLTYWSFFLAPLIFAIRFSQRIKLKLIGESNSKITSDVKLPSNFINRFFYKLVNSERNLPFCSPFGSSLFVVLQKK